VYQVVAWLLVARTLLVMVHSAAPTALAPIVGLVVLLSDPLVAPFAPHFRPLLFGRLVLDLAALVALAAYWLIEGLGLWLLGGGIRGRGGGEAACGARGGAGAPQEPGVPPGAPGGGNGALVGLGLEIEEAASLVDEVERSALDRLVGAPDVLADD